MKIREIINSSQAPSSLQDLWLDRGSLKYFSGSGWKAINASGEQYFSPSVFLSIGDSDEVKASNLAALSPISVGDPFQCEINYGFGVGRMSSSGGICSCNNLGRLRSFL